EPVEQVFPVPRTGGRRVHEVEGGLARYEREALEVFPVVARQGLHRPLGRDARVDVEPRRFRAAARGGVMVAEEHGAAALPHAIEALVRTRTVADDIAEADDAIRTAPVELGQHRVECFEIAVDVREDRRGHPTEGRASWAIRSRIPFTKDPEVSIPYFFAISLASSRATRAGVSKWLRSSAAASRITD